MKAALEHSARVNRRSQNAEAIVWLEERTGSIGQRWREPDLLRRIERNPWVTEMTPQQRYVASARSDPGDLRLSGCPRLILEMPPVTQMLTVDQGKLE